MIDFSFYASDINECVTKSHSCHADAVCHNTNGTYNCTCKTGFVGNGKTCTGKYLINKLTSVFSCVCPVIDNEFRHNIVKVAVDPQTTLTML